jgi:putative FmdB family regulatory protein
MPIYEYFCATCKETFETLRLSNQADQPALCPSCRSESKQRVLSLVASSVVRNGEGAAAGASNLAMSGGGGCCGGACGCSH